MIQDTKKNAAEMFMPTLLDRLSLTDETGPNGQYMNRQSYRKSVLRDLQWLLNCPSLEAQLHLENFEHVKASVINFGIPSYTGSKFTQSDLKHVADSIKLAVMQYEPRIIANTLEVNIVHDANQYSLCEQPLFRIEASLWFEPYPIELVIRALWDSENGAMRLYDSN